MSKLVRRSQLVGVIFLIIFAVVVYRYYSIQVVEASFYQNNALQQYERSSVLEASRGSIYDRHSNPLAMETSAYTVIAYLSEKAPGYVKDPVVTAQQLAPLLNMSEQRIRELLTQNNRYQVEIRPRTRTIDRQTMLKIKALDLPGIVFEETHKRYYPHDTFASHVLGFVNHDGEAAMGLEVTLNDYLQGTPGKLNFKKDNRNNILPSGVQGIEPPQDGHDVYTTLDERIQLYVEQTLDEVEEEFSPERMSVIVSDPHTGEVLAMSSRPSFNPNHYYEIQDYLNQSISSTYEPGSTFKIVTLAAAVQEGLFDPEETFRSGSFRDERLGSSRTIHDHRREGWGEISFLEGVQRSSNVAFVKLGWERMDRAVFYDYIYRFGFGERTGIDLANEQPGRVIPSSQAYDGDVATMTFGQAISVTSIQQVQAINAIANGGRLMRPYVIDRIQQRETAEIIVQNEPEVVNDAVITAATAKEVTDILASTITEGTGQRFYIDGYPVAGKTGTAEKPAEDGGFISGQYIHSFVGFAPKDDPRLSIHIMVDSPQLDDESTQTISTRGSAIVASIFKSIMQKSLQYLSVVPEVEHIEIVTDEDLFVPTHNFRGMSALVARQKAELEGYKVQIIGSGNEISEQLPAPESLILPGETLYLIAGSLDRIQAPDFTEWTLREVLDWAFLAQVEIQAAGHGYVRSQNVAPGDLLSSGSVVQIELEPKYVDQVHEDEAIEAETEEDQDEGAQIVD